MGQPQVSVILPTYNRAGKLDNCIKSVLSQTMTNLEFLILDDGSTDDTEQVVSAYGDSRIRYIRLDRNRHICYALNRGLREASGKYLARIDSDDSWVPDKLEKQIRYLEAHPECGACFTFAKIVPVENPRVSALFHTAYETRGEWLRRFFTKGNALCHPSAVMRRSVLEETGLYNLLYVQQQDLDMWIRIASVSDLHVIPEELVNYCWEESDQISSLTPQVEERCWNEAVLIREHFFDLMSGETFKDCFREDFRNPESSSCEELACEQAFLQMKYPYMRNDMTSLGVRKLEQIVNREGGPELLEDQFGFTLQDLYKLNQIQNLYTRLTEDEYALLSDMSHSRFWKLMRLLERKRKH